MSQWPKGKTCLYVSSGFSKDLSHEAKAKTNDFKFKIVLEDEDLSSRTPTLETKPGIEKLAARENRPNRRIKIIEHSFSCVSFSWVCSRNKWEFL